MVKSTALLAAVTALSVLILRALVFPGVWTRFQWLSIAVVAFVPAESAWLILFAYARSLDLKEMQKLFEDHHEKERKTKPDERNN